MHKPRWHIRAQHRPSSVSEVLDILLANRGVDHSFLNGGLKDLQVHVHMRGLKEGAELMARHLAQGHKIVLVGDYDCDGITSLAQMSLLLRDIDYQNFVAMIPTRAEGYGVPDRAWKDHPDARLFVVLDCGTADIEAITRIRELGADCIVIDHHEVPPPSAGGVAPATVLINPKQVGCPSAFKEFCSSGLTLLFLTQLRKALRKHSRDDLQVTIGAEYMSLAALATVADVVPLIDGNRIITRVGLAHLNQRPQLPLRQVAEAAGLTGRDLTAVHLGYNIAPRINAAGRIGDPMLAYQLLISENQDQVRRLAQNLNQLNTARQQQESRILEDVYERFTPAMANRRTVVMADPSWASGLVGIIASRIQQELFFGPTVVLAIDEQRGIARGSARSVPGFNIHDALERCDDVLLRWGGHRMAAGLTVALEQLELFVDRLEAVAQEMEAAVFIPRGEVDLELDLEFVTSKLLTVIKQLEPHGHGNPMPCFAARNVSVGILKTFGRNAKHLRLSIGNKHQGIFWNGAQHRHSVQQQTGNGLDAVFQVQWDHYRHEPILYVKDLGNLLD
jgi:single-stranded-DNA-specific exonuclease